MCVCVCIFCRCLNLLRVYHLYKTIKLDHPIFSWTHEELVPFHHSQVADLHISESVLNSRVTLWGILLGHICEMSVPIFFSKLNNKADWIFILSMCSKCNTYVVGMKYKLPYTSYSLNVFPWDRYETGWVNPLLADSVSPAIVNLEMGWHKEKDWRLIPISLCSKELQLMVLQKNTC